MPGPFHPRALSQPLLRSLHHTRHSDPFQRAAFHIPKSSLRRTVCGLHDGIAALPPAIYWMRRSIHLPAHAGALPCSSKPLQPI